MITVYGTPPTRAMRVVWMLEEMDLPYDLHSVRFDQRFSDAEFMEVSPTGAFPGLRDGDARLMESCAILEYLGAKYGPTPLTPRPGDESYPTYIAYLHFGEGSLAAPLNVTIASRFSAPEGEKENWGAGFAIDNFVRKSAALLRPLAHGSYMAGDTFTAADISCGYALGLAKFLGFEERLDPRLREYAGRLAQRPAFQRAMSKQQPLS
jgi:glutathione S-transferase